MDEQHLEPRRRAGGAAGSRHCGHRSIGVWRAVARRPNMLSRSVERVVLVDDRRAPVGAARAPTSARKPARAVDARRRRQRAERLELEPREALLRARVASSSPTSDAPEPTPAQRAARARTSARGRRRRPRRSARAIRARSAWPARTSHTAAAALGPASRDRVARRPPHARDELVVHPVLRDIDAAVQLGDPAHVAIPAASGGSRLVRGDRGHRRSVCPQRLIDARHI